MLWKISLEKLLAGFSVIWYECFKDTSKKILITELI